MKTAESRALVACVVACLVGVAHTTPAHAQSKKKGYVPQFINGKVSMQLVEIEASKLGKPVTLDANNPVRRKRRSTMYLRGSMFSLGSNGLTFAAHKARVDRFLFGNLHLFMTGPVIYQRRLVECRVTTNLRRGGAVSDSRKPQRQSFIKKLRNGKEHTVSVVVPKKQSSVSLYFLNERPEQTRWRDRFLVKSCTITPIKD